MLRYSTKHRTVKIIDSSRWRTTPIWKQVQTCEKAEVDVTKEVTLGKIHDDRKIIRRSSIR